MNFGDMKDNILKKINLLAISIFCTINIYSQINDNDNNTYKEVRIGKSIWMGSNLRVVTFNNGDTIAYAKTAEEMAKFTNNEIPAYCEIDFNENNDTILGKVYNSFALLDPRGIAPSGFKIPSIKDLNYIEDYVFNPLKDSLDKLKNITNYELYDINANEYFKDALKPDTTSGIYKNSVFDLNLAKLRPNRKIYISLKNLKSGVVVQKQINYNKNLSLNFNFIPCGFLRIPSLSFENVNIGGWMWIIGDSQNNFDPFLYNIYPSKRGGGDFKTLASVIRCVRYSE
jgi:uncharacterized protein (TIGR02145 family)